MTIYFCEGNYFILIIPFQHTHQIPLHIFVDCTVAGEGSAAFFVAAEGADQVRILDLFVEVTDKAAAGQMGRCNFVERTDFLFAGGWIIDYDRTAILGLAWNILDSPVNYICLGKFIEVSHTTADQTLKDKYIPLNCQGWSGRQISLI